MNDEPVWSQWTEWSLSRPHSPRWPEPNRLYRVRNCVRPITDYNGENYHKCPGEFYEVKQNDIKVSLKFQCKKKKISKFLARWRSRPIRANYVNI